MKFDNKIVNSAYQNLSKSLKYLDEAITVLDKIHYVTNKFEYKNLLSSKLRIEMCLINLKHNYVHDKGKK